MPNLSEAASVEKLLPSAPDDGASLLTSTRSYSQQGTIRETRDERLETDWFRTTRNATKFKIPSVIRRRAFDGPRDEMRRLTVSPDMLAFLSSDCRPPALESPPPPLDFPPSPTEP